MDQAENLDLERRVQAHEELLIAVLQVVHKVNPEAFSEIQRLFEERRGRTVHVEGSHDALHHAEGLVRTASKLEGF